MSKIQRLSQVSQGKIPARHWGNVRDYTDVLEILSDCDAVREGSSFMEELGLKACMVKIDFFHFRFFR